MSLLFNEKISKKDLKIDLTSLKSYGFMPMLTKNSSKYIKTFCY